MADSEEFEQWREALMKTSTPKVKKLLKSGASVHQTDEHGRTPLLWLATAAWMCPKKDKLAECAKLLLEAGADPNVVEKSQKPFENVLMYAIRDNNPAFVKAVLETGADLEFTNPEGQTAIDLASHRGASQEIQEMLVAAGSTRTKDYSLDQAAFGGDLKGVQSMLASGVPVDQPDERGRPPIFYAAINGHEQVFMTLLEAGADPNTIGVRGDNLLIAAARSGNDKIVSELIKLGLEINGGKDSGQTPLLTAIESDHLSTVKILLAAGANPRKRNVMGDTADKLARRCDKSIRAEMIALLEAAGVQSDAVLDAPKQFKQAAESDAYQTYKTQLTETLQTEPKDWTKHKAVAQYNVSRFDKLANAWAAEIDEHKDAGAEEHFDLYLLHLQDHAREAGFFLCSSDPPDHPKRAKILLFPTNDQLAAVAAFKTSAPNYGYDTSDVIAWLRRLHQEAPFTILYAGKDCVGARFFNELQNPLSIAERIVDFCPDTLDGDIVTGPEDLAKSMEESPSFDLWWD